MAAVGALLVSSGIALMAAPTPASAQNDHPDKVVVCKYVGTPGASELQTGQNPIEVSVNTLNNLDPPWDGTFPWAWTDAQGQAGNGSVAVGYVGEIPSTLSSCPGYEPEVLQAAAVAVPVDPTCEANVASYSTEGSVGVASWDESAEPAFGTTITLTAHAAEGYAFGESSTTTVEVSFGTEATGCTNVEPPVVEPPVVEPPVVESTTVETPTVVHAGLAGATASTSTEQQGLALILAGLLLLAGAGGLVVVKGGERR
jgi:hypothetical protein